MGYNPTVKETPLLSSGVKASSVLIRTGAAVFGGIVLTAAGDAASATLYDNTTNSGTILSVVKAGAGATVAVSGPLVQAGTGLYVVITGTSPSCVVYYLPLG